MRKSIFKAKGYVKKKTSSTIDKSSPPYIVQEPDEPPSNPVNETTPYGSSSSPKREEILHWIFTGESPFLFNYIREDVDSLSTIEKSSPKDSEVHFKRLSETPINLDMTQNNKSFKTKTVLNTIGGNISMAIFNVDCDEPASKHRMPLKENNKPFLRSSTPISYKFNNRLKKEVPYRLNVENESLSSDSSVLTCNYIKSVNKNGISNDNHIRNLRNLSKTDHCEKSYFKDSKDDVMSTEHSNIFLNRKNLQTNGNFVEYVSNPEWSTFKSNPKISPNRYNPRRNFSTIPCSFESNTSNFKDRNNLNFHNFSTNEVPYNMPNKYKNINRRQNFESSANVSAEKKSKQSILRSVRKTISIESNGPKNKIVQVIQEDIIYKG